MDNPTFEEMADFLTGETVKKVVDRVDDTLIIFASGKCLVCIHRPYDWGIKEWTDLATTVNVLRQTATAGEEAKAILAELQSDGINLPREDS